MKNKDKLRIFSVGAGKAVEPDFREQERWKPKNQRLRKTKIPVSGVRVFNSFINVDVQLVPSSKAFRDLQTSTKINTEQSLKRNPKHCNNMSDK